MKNIVKQLTILVALTMPMLASAQLGKAYEMNINGVKVIVQPSGNEIVSIQTAIAGGVQNKVPAGKDGIEQIAVSGLVECGTAGDDKNSFKNKLDKVSARVSTNAGMEYATISLNCIKSDFETVWPLYTAAMLSPRFDANEFARIKNDAITIIRANESDPDNALDKMARQTAFKGKTYAKSPEGTVATISTITNTEAKKYWQSIFTKSKMIIVVVADLDKADIEAKVKAFLSKVPAGTPFTMKKETYSPLLNTFTPMSRENATNYVQGITSGPVAGGADFNAFALAMRIFYTRHFVEVRSKNGLSYAPGVWLNQGATSYANLYVTTTEPDKYIAVARQLIDKIKAEGFTEQELKNMKVQFLTNIYTRQETNDAQAGSLVFSQLVHGNWQRSNTLNEQIKKVTLDELNASFRKYMTNITWTYQGDTKKVNPVLYTQKQTPKMPEEKKAF